MTTPLQHRNDRQMAMIAEHLDEELAEAKQRIAELEALLREAEPYCPKSFTDQDKLGNRIDAALSKQMEEV